MSAIAVLALGAGAAVAAPVAAGLAPDSAFAAPVAVEIADASRAPLGALYVGLMGPETSSFAFATDTVSVAGHLVVAPPRAFSLSNESLASLADVRVSQIVAPGMALEFGYGDTGLAAPNRLDADGLFLFDSALTSPTASLAAGGGYAGARIDFGDVRFRFGAATRGAWNITTGGALSPLPDELLASSGTRMRAHTLSAGVDWAVTDWAAIGVTATQASERGSVLGSALAGPVGVSEGADTTALNVSARVGFGDGWVTTVAFDQGVTRLDLQPAFAISGRDTLYSQSYGIALTKEGLFGDDVLGISVSRPLQSGGMTFGTSAFGPRARLPVTALTDGRGAPQSDIQMGYVTTFLDGSLALSANAGYQTNVNGEQGRDGVTAAARARIRF